MSVPGLQKRIRKNGTVAWYWSAPHASRLAKDYPLKIRRIQAANQDEAEVQAWQFTAELRLWLAARPGAITYAGTVGSLIDCYRADETSPYQAVRESTRRSYDHDLKLLKDHVGAVRIATLTRAVFFRWHQNFAAPAVTKDADGNAVTGEPRIRRAHGLMTMVRMLLSFGVSMRFAGCKAAQEVIGEMKFEMPAPRRSAMTFAQASAIIDKAIEMGARSIALGQAIQFELGLRQIDVIGQWVSTTERDAGLIRQGKQWTGGLTWADLTAERLVKRTSKTGQEGIWVPSEYPLLVKVIAAFADHERIGVAIIDERRGAPYNTGDYSKRWRTVATAAGIPGDVWNMDSRAGAITEGDEAGANPEDVRKFATHANRQTTDRYSRQSIQATSRVAQLRLKLRSEKAE
jgi:hypothetical protein